MTLDSTPDAADGGDALPPPIDAAAAVADSCIRLMRGFARVKTQLLALARDDVDWSARLLITWLAAEGPMRSSELADKVQSDPSTVSRQVASLVKDGYVERRADPVDGRASLLAASDCSIDPLVAAEGVEFTSEHRHGGLFATRRPPVNDFDVRSAHRGAAKQGGSHQGHHRHD